MPARSSTTSSLCPCFLHKDNLSKTDCLWSRRLMSSVLLLLLLWSSRQEKAAEFKSLEKTQSQKSPAKTEVNMYESLSYRDHSDANQTDINSIQASSDLIFARLDKLDNMHSQVDSACENTNQDWNYLHICYYSGGLKDSILDWRSALTSFFLDFWFKLCCLTLYFRT